MLLPAPNVATGLPSEHGATCAPCMCSVVASGRLTLTTCTFTARPLVALITGPGKLPL